VSDHVDDRGDEIRTPRALGPDAVLGHLDHRRHPVAVAARDQLNARGASPVRMDDGLFLQEIRAASREAESDGKEDQGTRG
jgi:hypothetical protein